LNIRAEGKHEKQMHQKYRGVAQSPNAWAPFAAFISKREGREKARIFDRASRIIFIQDLLFKF